MISPSVLSVVWDIKILHQLLSYLVLDIAVSSLVNLSSFTTLLYRVSQKNVPMLLESVETWRRFFWTHGMKKGMLNIGFKF